MPLSGQSFFRQWRRLLLILAAILTLIANILVQQSLSKDIFDLEISLNGDVLGDLMNSTESAVSSVASEAVEAATSQASKAKSKAKSIFGDATSEIGNLFLAVPTQTAEAIDVAGLPTPAPVVASLVRRDIFDFLNTTDSDNITDGINIHIKPHTTVDLGDVGDIPVLGTVLNFVMSLVISVTPLGLLHLVHLLVIIFGWIYFARLLFRILSASPTPPAGTKTSKGSIALQLVSYMPCVKGPQMMVRAVALVFVPIVMAGLAASAFAAQWIDYKIQSHVQDGDYESFLDLVTIELDHGPAPGLVRAAMILLYISLAIDVCELVISLFAMFRRKQRKDDSASFEWGGTQQKQMSQLASKISYPMRPQPAFHNYHSGAKV